ncbi:hypothetical protein ACN469_12905 [Corallococcus terminator]
MATKKRSRAAKQPSRRQGPSLPPRVFAQASPRSIGGVSLFDVQEQISTASVVNFLSERDIVQRAVLRLKDAGFDILRTLNMPPTTLLQDSLLLRQGGFGLYEGLPDAPTCQLLLEDALRRSTTDARRAHTTSSDSQPERGGAPGRDLLNMSGGVVLQRLYSAPTMLDWLRRLTWPGLQPSGGQGTYSFYLQPGDHLDLHRDVAPCEVAVITCLLDALDAQAPGGRLTLYPQRVAEPLQRIRQSPEAGRVTLRLRPRQTLVMLGGLVPHAVEPVVRGQSRIVSVLCYH